MRKNGKQFGLETLERREVFTGVTGVEGFAIYDTPVQYTDTVEVQRIRHEVREHDAFGFMHGRWEEHVQQFSTDLLYQ